MRLALRNAVAELVIEAFAAPAEVGALRALAAALARDGTVVAPPQARRLLATGLFQAVAGQRRDGATRLALRSDLGAERHPAAARADRGVAVAERYWREAARPARRTDRRDAALATALAQAALLFEARLFFEVHEVLEAVWHRLEGDTKTFVQGLIQVAVALHHVDHGNPRGAARLFASGRARLVPHSPSYLGIGVDDLLASLVPFEEAARAGRAAPAGASASWHASS